MKIIVAGFAKTGTKSLTAALTELGYVVYDYLENFSYLGDDWQRILTKGGTTDDFRRMYDNVDVTIDSPVYFYWEEIHRAFPDAKIILSIRDEDSWLNSLKKQSDEISNNTVLHFMQTLSPTGRKFFKFSQTWVMAVFGIFMKSPFHDIPFNDMLHRITYRQHNKYVLGTAPKDKLLVYKVKDGWKPLCDFLEKEIPDKPFPHRNKGGAFFAENKLHPALVKMHREMLLSGAALFTLGALGFYQAYRYFS